MKVAVSSEVNANPAQLESMDWQVQEHTGHVIAREIAAKDGLYQLVSKERSSLEHLNQHIRTNNVVMLRCKSGMALLLALMWLMCSTVKHSMLTSWSNELQKI